MLQEARTGDWLSSAETTWRAISQQLLLDPGFTIYQTREPLYGIRLGIDGEDLISVLVAPQPVPYFSFERYAQPLASVDIGATWLYSVFGYALADQVVCLRIYPTQEIEYLLLKRPVAFPW